ncbi:sugar ABC transporter ATP-binding protein [Camelliibacillus cellulosilyticus]|uniref:Sugar ABC transporter ATP-binding protein n=1 Tax=Camelliibacillus cellulosilyticus TaxID=2174486 RepID=A0ABV9GU60_9BACL
MSQSEPSQTPLLEMRDIKKSFNHNEVLHGVHLTVNKGEIHALLGENGAGKSTLMNILGGVILANKGNIKLNGKEAIIQRPGDAIASGISFIHQELNVVNDLKVYENMFLGTEIRNRFGFLNVAEMCAKTKAVLDRLGVDIDPKATVRDLETSYKQMIEIARSLLKESKLIIMDEPTTSITDHEIEKLFQVMRSLRASGVSIIYISHKLKEVEAICDRYTVLRDGQFIETGSMKDVNLEHLTKLMVGKSINDNRLYQQRATGEPVLTVKDLSVDGLFQNINFTVRRGEIIGFTGLAGDGRTELFETIFGYRRKTTGDIAFKGKKLKVNHPKKALKAGIGLVPKNRKETAILKDLSVIQNMSISSLNHFEKLLFLSARKEKKVFDQYKTQLNIKVNNPNATIESLSGGNQQKVMISRWLEVNSELIIFDNPTQGIDVGAKNEIYQHIMRLAESGKAIIILSSEAPEILKVCDTIKVMFKGQMVATLNRDEATEEKIMGFATGSFKEGEAIG